MNSNLEKALYKIAVMTFEELSFMLPTPELEEQQQDAPVEAAVSVEFWGPFNGKLVLKICGGLLSTLAINMLGEEELPTEQLQRDALGEIANVICGNVLPAIAGSKNDSFKLSAPQTVEAGDSPDGASPEPPVAEAHIGMEQGRADVLLFVNNKTVL